MFSVQILNHMYPPGRNSSEWKLEKGAWTRRVGRNTNRNFELTCVCGELKSDHGQDVAHPIRCKEYREDT